MYLVISNRVIFIASAILYTCGDSISDFRQVWSGCIKFYETYKT